MELGGHFTPKSVERVPLYRRTTKKSFLVTDKEIRLSLKNMVRAA